MPAAHEGLALLSGLRLEGEHRPLLRDELRHNRHRSADGARRQMFHVHVGSYARLVALVTGLHQQMAGVLQIADQCRARENIYTGVADAGRSGGFAG